MDQPLAYLLTWRTHGTWLHGDSRGSVDTEHNVVGTPLLAPDTCREHTAAARMRSPAVVLTDAARCVVADVIARHCRIRGWELIELAVRTNHVHLVVAYAGLPPEPMIGQFKAYATRELRREGLACGRTPVWAEHGSTRYLWKTEHVAAAVEYVHEAQDLPHE